MSLVHCDGFADWSIATCAMEGYTLTDANGLLSIATGRRAGGSALKLTAGASSTVAATMTRNLPGGNIGSSTVGITVHMSLKIDALPSANCTFFQVVGNGQPNLSVVLGSDGVIRFYPNGQPESSGISVANTSGQQFTLGQWFTFEFSINKFVGSSSGGTIDARINGTSVVAASNVATSGTSSAYMSGYRLGPTSRSTAAVQPTWTMCDLVVILGDGTSPNTFTGSLQVHTLNPDGAGDSTGLTPSTGANWQCVDETGTITTTDYVETASTGVKDLYTFTGLTDTPATIYGAYVKAIGFKDDTAVRTLRTTSRNGSTNADLGSALTLTINSWVPVYGWSLTDPNTSAAWTKAGLDTAQFGVLTG